MPQKSNTKKLGLTCTEFVVWKYSAGQKKCYKYCFMKQKFQIQMGMARYINVTTPLRTIDINATHKHFQIRYVTLF